MAVSAGDGDVPSLRRRRSRRCRSGAGAGDGPAAAARRCRGRRKALRYRDFLTVALVVPEDAGFPDNWIYVHSPDVRLGRVQNFGSWSPGMVRPGTTCLGLEYFVNEGDDLWVDVRRGAGRASPWTSWADGVLRAVGGRARLRRAGAEGLSGLRRRRTRGTSTRSGHGWRPRCRTSTRSDATGCTATTTRTTRC